MLDTSHAADSKVDNPVPGANVSTLAGNLATEAASDAGYMAYLSCGGCNVQLMSSPEPRKDPISHRIHPSTLYPTAYNLRDQTSNSRHEPRTPKSETPAAIKC